MGRISKHAAALAAGAVFIVAGGGAYALASSSGGTITVCASHKGGTLYKAKKCSKHDNALTWNKQGPQGPQGKPGINGTNGTNGATGPSDAFSGSIAGPVTITSSTSAGDKVGHLDLPPGTYVIVAKAWIENQSGITSTAGCELAAGTDSDVDVLTVEPAGVNAYRGTVALNVAHTFTSSGTAQLSCFSGSGVTVTANNAVVTAIKVGSLTANALIAG